MITKQTIYKVKCICGKTIHGRSLEALESGWQSHHLENKCKSTDYDNLVPLEKEFYKELKMKRGK